MKLYNNPLPPPPIFRPHLPPSMATKTYSEGEKPSQKTLPIIRSLIFQPLLVLLDTTNLLPVVIWDGITETLEGGVDAILLDVLEEFSLSLCLISTSPIHPLHPLPPPPSF